MNCILYFPSELSSSGTVRFSDHRFEHIRDVLKSAPSERIRVGEREGLLGYAEILSMDESSVTVRPVLTEEPPKPLPVTLITAMPRPKSFRKLLHTAVVMGVKEIHVIKSWKVDKSYWSTPFLTPQGVDEIVLDGLMQARDTISPAISIHKGFKPFAEDTLPKIAAQSELMVFHPAESASSLRAERGKNYTVIIGPEGGFIPYEIEMLERAGAEVISLGARIQRVEQAIGSVLGYISIALME